MKTSHRRKAGETLALLSAISLGLVERLVLHSAPATERPMISRVPLAAALPAFVLTATSVREGGGTSAPDTTRGTAGAVSDR
ncbi:hypothetical protein [Streptomyces sp. TP-A0356]|uniref:hypothetical protein n=1 Tax=Streptomyces sp. TP-A0356 TaxID=1359208 RepID=UPI0006E1AB07|nr:hypothetical protein [Streptomyces sp. TP-A0356]